MTKKILLSLVAVAVVIGGVAAMSAYEAHVINVTAHIENALAVETTPIEFGTVFPQEYVERDFTINLSSSFLAADRVDDINYVIKQKPKPNPAGIIFFDGDIVAAREHCHTVTLPDPYCYLTLCPFLSKTDGDPEDNNDTSHIGYYVDPTPAEPNSGDEFCEVPSTDAAGRLSKIESDTSDLWILDLKVPPVAGYVGQDWPASCPTVSENNQDYGCDLWIEVTGISQKLILENKNPDTWAIEDDETFGILTYNASGPTFNYSLTAQGLAISTEYSLIYYADKPDRFVDWGGDNPGALIGSGTTDGSGNLTISGNPNLGMDLPSEPDANMDITEHDYCGTPDLYLHCTGAKIWLVLSGDYSAPKLTAWNPTTYLFETDLITYNDTDN